MGRRKNTDLKRERDRALYAAFRRGLAQGGYATMREAARLVCRQPAPRFYIEAEKAALLVGRILSGISLINMNACSRKLAWELYRRYMAYLEAHPDNTLSRERIMELLVEEPAPEFYIEAQRARKILYEERKKARAKWERWREI